jgi:hypothetical protein
MNKTVNWKRLGQIGLALILIFTLLIAGINLKIERNQTHYKLVVTCGDPVNASGIVPDVAGTTSTAVQAALNMVDPQGGKVQLYSPAYTFTTTVLRAINNVIIDGAGTTITYAGACFSVGSQTGWVFRDLSLAIGGTITGYTSALLVNVSIGTDHIEYQIPNTSTAADFVVPSGRTATYVIAASDATAQEKAQADYVMPSSSADVGIIITNAIALYGTNTWVQLTCGIFEISTQVIMNVAGVRLSGSGNGTYGMDSITKIKQSDNSNLSPIIIITATTCTLTDFFINGNSSQNPTAGDAIQIGNHDCNIHRVDVFYAKGNGFYLADATGTVITNSSAEYCGGSGYSFATNYSITAWGLHSAANADRGYKIVQTYDSTFSSCISFINTGSSKSGWYLDTSCHDLNIIGCTADGDTYGIVSNALTNYNINIQASNIVNCGSDGIFGLLNNWNIIGCTFKDNGKTTNNTFAHINLYTGSKNNIISNNQFKYVSGNKAKYLVIESATSSENIISYNQMPNIAYATSAVVMYSSQPIGNIGYIAPGEIRTYSGTITATARAANSFPIAWQNPNAQKVLVTRFVIELTAAGGTATAVMDVGLGATATTHSDNLLDGIDINTTGFYDSLNDTDNGTNGISKPQTLDESGGTTDYITGQILTEKADTLAATYYITVVGR